MNMKMCGRVFARVRMEPLLCTASLLLAGCHSSGVDRYKLEGRVLSVDKSANIMVVDCKEIPGKMDAMTMSFAIPAPGLSDKLSPGDQISADMVIPRQEGAGSHLENLVIIQKARATNLSSPAPPAEQSSKP